MDRATFVRLLKTEITRHSFDTFVDEPPSVAKSDRGVVVPGCSTCGVRAETTNRFLEHIAQGLSAWFDATVPPRSAAVEQEQSTSYPA
jgi:transcription elongation factor Elf1